MSEYGLYVICKEYLGDVKKFLGIFFKEYKGRYNNNEWVTFKIPNNNFIMIV